MDSAPLSLSAFLSTACFRCFAPSSSTSPSGNSNLKRCSACRRVRYCSPACAAADWADHKPLCRALSAIRSPKVLAPVPPLAAGATPEEVKRKRDRQFARWAEEDDLLQAALKRAPTPAEGQVLWRERRCGCQVVHLAEQIDRHLLAEHLAAASAPTTTSNKDPTASPPKPPQPVFIPPRVLPSPSALPSSWADYLAALCPSFPSSAEFDPSPARLYGQLLPPLAPALTVLASLRRLFPAAAGAPPLASLTLLLLDSTPLTVPRTTLALEELFHLVPSLLSLRTLTVAPQDAAVSAPALGADGQPLPGGQEEVRVKGLPLCRECGAKGRRRTLEHVKSLEGVDLSAAAARAAAVKAGAGPGAEDHEADEEKASHVVLALAWNTSLALCEAPLPSSSSAASASAIAPAPTPTERFWAEQVFAPLSRLASPSPSSSKNTNVGVGFVLAAQTAEDASSSLSFARSHLPLSQGLSQGEGEGEGAASWAPERNAWRDPRPRVEGWWDHRREVPEEGEKEGKERDRDGGISWAGGWSAGFRLDGGGGSGGSGALRGEEKVGR
ncbi:hypothetical protein JCM6882_006957 [Rhodosporidiobolus microsporus]